MIRFSRLVSVLVAAAALWWGGAVFDRAAAQSCSFGPVTVNFGSVDVTANTVYDTPATLTVNCTGLVTMKVCVSLGPGTGGATSAANRFLANGANTLRFVLFQNSAAGPIWGSDTWAGAGAPSVAVNVPVLLGSGSATLNILARVYAGQQAVPAGTYTTTLSGGDAQMRFGALSGVLGCDVLTGTFDGQLTVSATVPTTCRVSASDLDFGPAGPLTANVDGSTTVSPTCTSGTPYTVGLNGGLANATDPTQRKMSKGAESVMYGLFRDTARSQPFGNAIGTNTVGGTGSGLAQPIPVYGRVAPQATPSPGLYSDTIVATVTY